MTRSATRRVSTVQVEKSLPPAPSKDNSGDPRPPLPASLIPWYWRLALFLWCTSFVILLLYEWLAGIIKAW
ncbi:MAG: hypothetical protein ACYC3I_21415 [Gemmataceae bacterium]